MTWIPIFLHYIKFSKLNGNDNPECTKHLWNVKIKRNTINIRGLSQETYNHIQFFQRKTQPFSPNDESSLTDQIQCPYNYALKNVIHKHSCCCTLILQYANKITSQWQKRVFLWKICNLHQFWHIYAHICYEISDCVYDIMVL